MKRKTLSKPTATTCSPTDHMFIHVEVTPLTNYNTPLGGLGQYPQPQPSRRFVLYCTKCAATKAIQ